jgi:ABC-type proline/glycine betaine transport system substrate-binding protein
LAGILIICLTTSSVWAQRPTEDVSLTVDPSPVAGETISMARATWDTGWFQTEVFRLLLESLGYAVGYPETMDNLQFYLAAARGDVDLWVNGWFPSHNVFIQQDSVRGKVQPVGFEVIAGALQGYLVDKRTAEKLNISSLSDLQRPEVSAAFDRNGNGKADLIGCNVGWATATARRISSAATWAGAVSGSLNTTWGSTICATPLSISRGIIRR